LVGSSAALDIPGLIVVSGSDSQGLLVEVPDLSLSTIWCLDDHISVVDEIEVSVLLQFGNDVEVSLNIHTEVGVKLTFNWLIWILISIDNLPLLVDFTVLVVDDKVLVLIIKATSNIQNFSSLVDDEGTVLFEELPPS